jgi:hypothetical protein
MSDAWRSWWCPSRRAEWKLSTRCQDEGNNRALEVHQIAAVILRDGHLHAELRAARFGLRDLNNGTSVCPAIGLMPLNERKESLETVQ